MTSNSHRLKDPSRFMGQKIQNHKDLIRSTLNTSRLIIVVNLLVLGLQNILDIVSIQLIVLLLEAFSSGAGVSADLSRGISLFTFNDLSSQYLNMSLLNHPEYLFLSLVFLFIIIQITKSAAVFVYMSTSGILASRCQQQFINFVFDQISTIGYEQFSQLSIGEVVDVINSGPIGLRKQIEKYSSLLLALTQILAYTLYIYIVSIKLFAFTLVIISVCFCLVRLFFQPIRSASEIVRKQEYKLANNLIEYIGAMSYLYRSGNLSQAIGDIEDLTSGLYRTNLSLNRSLSFLPSISAMLAPSIIALVLCFFYFNKFFGSQASLPVIASYILILQRMSSSLNTLNQVLSSLTSNKLLALAKIDSFLDSVKSQSIGKKASYFSKSVVFTPLNTGNLIIDNLCYRYPNASSDAIHNLHCTIYRGMSNAIVGASGSGKSTLLDLLLLNLYPKSGNIELGSDSLYSLSEQSWKQHIGFVSQDSLMLNRSIYSNLTHGLKDVSLSHIINMCQVARIYDLISQLPDGFDTLIGVNGIQLSGGETQRLSIARALIRDSQFLICDEPTSALDPITQVLLMNDLCSNLNGKTLIIVTHALSLVKDFDNIIVLGNGCIQGSGTHKDLIKSCPSYSSLLSYSVKRSLC